MTGPAPTTALQLDGVYNFRDLGGLAVADGVTASGRLFRSDGLHRSPAEERSRLAEIGIRNVIDLRTQEEIDREGRFEADGIQWSHAPLVQRLTDFINGAGSGDSVDLLCRHYEHMVTENADAIGAALGRIADSVDEGPTVFHCTAGKDRTGVLAALILTGVGVADELVVEDFARSTSGVQQMVAWYRQHHGMAPVEKMSEMGMPPELVDTMMSSEPTTMATFLARRRAEEGGLDGFLARLGAVTSVERIGQHLLA